MSEEQSPAQDRRPIWLGIGALVLACCCLTVIAGTLGGLMMTDVIPLPWATEEARSSRDRDRDRDKDQDEEDEDDMDIHAEESPAEDTPTLIPPPIVETEEPVAEEEAEEIAEEAEEEPITLTLWHTYYAGDVEEETLLELVENAHETYPDLDITVQQIPYDQINDMWAAGVAAGKGPDMFILSSDRLGQWVDAGLVANLDKYENQIIGYAQPALDGMTIDASLYGIPESASLVALYYNKSLVDSPATTTDELLSQVEEGSSISLYIGSYHMFGWPGAFGGQLLDDEGKCIADQGGWVEALNYLLDLQDAGAVMSTNYGEADDYFVSGKAAYTVNGPWSLSLYRKVLGDDLGVIKLPSGPDGDATPLLGIYGYYINPNSPNQEAAVRLALFLTNDTSAQLLADEAGHIPVRPGVEASDPILNAFVDATAFALPITNSDALDNYWSPFGDMFEAVLEETVSSKEAVTNACAALGK